MSRRALGRLSLLWLLAGAALAAGGAAEPRVAVDGAGRLVISRLPPLLAEASLRRHLDSGLTTSLIFQGGPPGATDSGAARVDLRLELWDELYLVTLIGGDGAIQRLRLASFEELAAWWSEVEIVLSPDADAAAAARRARVSLAVVPFSQAELVDAQRWLVESIGQSQGRDGRGGAGTGAVGALIATSMQRRAVRTVVWSVPVEEPAER